MRDSQVVAEWMTEAEIRARVRDVLRLLEKKFPPVVPEEITAVVKASTDLQQLNRWFDAAIDAASLDDFRRALVS